MTRLNKDLTKNVLFIVVGTKIPEELRLEVLRLFLLGHLRDEIVTKTGVSGGSVSNVVAEFEEDIEKGELEAIHQFFEHCRKSGITAVQAVVGARVSAVSSNLQLDLPTLEAYLKDMFRESQKIGITPEKFANICKDMIEAKESTDIPLQELPTYHRDLANDVKTLSAELDSIQQEIKKESEVLSTALKNNRVTLQRLEDYMNTKAELAEYEISMEDPVLLRNVLRNAKEKEYDLVKIATSISEIESLEQQTSDLQISVNNLRKEEREATISLASIKKQLEKHQILLDTFKDLSSIGFSLTRLKVIRNRITEISVANSFKQEEAVERFINHVESDYDNVLGFESKIGQGKSELIEIEQKVKSLELQYSAKKEVFDSMQGLMKKRVKGSDILAWNAALDKCDATPQEFYEELAKYESLKSLEASQQKELSELDKSKEMKKQELAELEGQIEECKLTKSKLEGGIQYIRESAIEKINLVSENSIKRIEDVRVKVSSTAKESINSISEVAQHLKNTVTEIKETSIGTVGTIAQDAKDTMTEIKETSIGTVGTIAQDAKDTMTEIKETSIGTVGNLAKKVKDAVTEINEATNKQREAVMEAGRFSGLRPIVDLVNKREVDEEELEKALLQVLKAYHSRLSFVDNEREPLGEVISAIENKTYILGGLHI